MSDNGGSNRRALRGGKGDLWEGGLRVPLIVRGPGVAAGSWSHQRVVGYDWFPTFCRWAGASEPLPAGVEGGDLRPLLAGSNEPVKRPREELYFHFPHYQGDTPHSAIYLGDHKLIQFYETGESQLYDLSKDPGEHHDLAAAMPELTADLTGRLSGYLRDVDAAMPRVNPDYDSANVPTLKQGGGKKGMRKERPERVEP